ncbi:MAG: PilZ domain-containing protein [Sphingomonadales bacterium]|nr:PilZ domain-containing protein [Sphingomonadales bacterium]
MPNAAARADQRRAPREAVDCRSMLWSGRSEPCAVQIVNISPYGCMVRGTQRVRIGERVSVDVPGLAALPGLVIWALNERCGIEFDAMIPLEPYLDMLATSKVASNGQPPA